MNENIKQEYPFKSNFLNIGDLHYHYVDESKDKDQVMLMVHGNPTWSFYYRNLIKHFSASMRTIAVDHIGCGMSSKPQDYEYTLENHVNNLVELVKFLDLKNITLVVHDWGGAIGMGLATQYPELIKRIIVLNTAAFHMDRLPKRIGLCRNKFFGEFLVRRLNGFAGPATFMTTRTKLAPDIKKGYLMPYNNYKNRIAIHRFVKDIPMEVDHKSRDFLDNIFKSLHKITTPILILWGGGDFCFDRPFFEKWREIFPESFYKYYPKAGHYILEDVGSDCIKEIDNFISVI